MAEDKDFQMKIQRIGQLVGELENIADPEARAGAKALVQLVLDLHAAGFERVMEIVAKSGEPGLHTIDDLGRRSAGQQSFSFVRSPSSGFGKSGSTSGGKSSSAGAQRWGRIGSARHRERYGPLASPSHRTRVWLDRQDSQDNG